MRLTTKIVNNYIVPDNVENIIVKSLNKLGQLEDIEEEFQIDNFDDLRERLKTYKFLANHEMSCVDVEGYNCMLKDLKEYHDIEEELGIDLITLFKALNSCWFLQISSKRILGDIRPKLVYDGGWHLKPNLAELPMIYSLKDYGKTWALTKEELTDGK